MKIHNRKLKIENTRFGFTLIELLMVIVVIVILVGLLLPVLVPSREDAKNRQRQLARRTLASAILTYRHEFMKWPHPNPGNDRTYSSDNHEVMAMLFDAGDDDIKMINWGAFAQDENRSIKCPDGNYYEIRFEGNSVYVDGTSVYDY